MTPQISLERGKIPPQALDLEEAVLGAMLIDKKGVDDVIDIISADVFYKKQHQLIYQAIFELFQNSEPIDLLTVAEQLRKTGNLEAAGSEIYLINLTQRVSSSANAEYHHLLTWNFTHVLFYSDLSKEDSLRSLLKSSKRLMTKQETCLILSTLPNRSSTMSHRGT